MNEQLDPRCQEIIDNLSTGIRDALSQFMNDLIDLPTKDDKIAVMTVSEKVWIAFFVTSYMARGGYALGSTDYSLEKKISLLETDMERICRRVKTEFTEQLPTTIQMFEEITAAKALLPTAPLH